MSSKRVMIAAVGCMALGACNTMNKNIGQEDPYLGEAVRYNAAVQTINPDPVYAADAAQPGDNGEKGADAVKRYRNDEVNSRHQSAAQETSSMSTTRGTSSGGGPR